MLDVVKHRINAYQQSTFEQVIEDSRNAVACMDFEAFLAGGINVFTSLRKVSTRWAELVASGKIEPDADVDETLWNCLDMWYRRSVDALPQLEQFECMGFDMEDARRFREVIHQAEDIMSHSQVSDCDLVELIAE